MSDSPHRRPPTAAPHPGRPGAATTLRGAVLLGTLLGVLLLGAGCSGSLLDDPILQLSSQEALDQGKALMAEEKYSRARDYLVHAFEAEPNSLSGREALLLAADSFYLDGGDTNLVQAEARYRDYLNRFPTSDRAAYVQFQIGNSLAQRMGRPDRDLSATEDALDAYRNLLRLYPTSEYAAQAREKIRLVRENLAEHELAIGEFYMDFEMPNPAAKRFQYLLDTYPEYSDLERVYFLLGSAHALGRRPLKAQEIFDRLAQRYPDSPYLNELPELLPPLEGTADEAGEDGEAVSGEDLAAEGDAASEDGDAGSAPSSSGGAR